MPKNGVPWGFSANDVGRNVGRTAEREATYRPGPGSDVDLLFLDASH